MNEITIENGIEYLGEIHEMISEYYSFLGRDLSFQDIESELANPTVKYRAPNGEIVVAVRDGFVLGMVVYHRLTDERCEMKRLYVKPEGRGMKIGELLARDMISKAVHAGYKEMVLDTIVPLKAAIHLYRKLGFEECQPYYHNPMDDVIYFSLDLKYSKEKN